MIKRYINLQILDFRWRGSATGIALDLRSVGRGFKSYSSQRCVTTLGKLFTPMCLWYRPKGGICSAAGKITAGLAESNGSLPPGGWLTVTCGPTACTQGSAPGPTLGIDYGKAFTFTLYFTLLFSVRLCAMPRPSIRPSVTWFQNGWIH